MASCIVRAPVLARSINRKVQKSLFSPLIGSRQIVIFHSQKRGYNNYKTHGEMAALKEPTDGKVYSDEAQYPEILDMTPSGIASRARQAHYDEVKGMPTAHHKMFIMNVERGREEMYYIGDLHYNSLELYQYATRTTHKMEESPSDARIDSIDSGLVSLIEEAIVTNSLTHQSCEREKRLRETNLIRCILDIIRYQTKVSDTVILEEPRIEAFWQHSNFRTNRDKERFEDQENFAPWFQYRQHAQLMISSEIPLQPIIPPQSETIFEENIPSFDYYPEELGMYRKKHRLASTAGYWCNAAHYPLVTTTSLSQVLPSSLDPSVNTDHLNASERRRRLAAHGLMMNFAAAVGSAYSCGFTCFHEVTYPFVTRHIVTDGQTWHFSTYQLNTMAFGPDFAKDKQNFAWSSEEMKLYDVIENGEVRGLNPSVLSRIVETVQAPRKAVDNPRPYCVAGVEREFLERGEKMFKDQATRKLKMGEVLNLEVPLWVKIYKMHEDAPPNIALRWQRPRVKLPTINQFNKEMYDAEIKEVKERMKKDARDLFFGLRPPRPEPKPLGVHPSGIN